MPVGTVTEVGLFDADRQPRPLARAYAELAAALGREDRVLRADERGEG